MSAARTAMKWAAALSLRDRVRIASCFVLGAIAAALLVPSTGALQKKESSAAPITAQLDGRPLALGEAALDDARVIAREWTAKRMRIAAAGAAPRELTREELGARIDPERLAAVVAEARDARSPLRRAARGTLSLPLPVSLDGSRAIAALVSLKDDLDKRPVDARLDVGGHRVLPDEPGRLMDVYATLARLEDALTRRDAPDQIDAVVENVPAKRTAAQIGEVHLEEIMGWFETKYARDQKHEARTFNLRLAASKLDGHVIMPGEVFDFNEVVGARSEANGYRVATVIAQGELVDGIGGGTCQVGGTLHGAAFFAGLDIIERRPHTRPSFYIKMGMDAAVAYPAITLKLRNPFPYPVVLHETVQGGVARAEILGPKRTRDVTFVRKTNDVTPFAEKEVPDPKVPKGERVLSQRGIPGFKITRYRLVRDGAFAVRERMTDAYPPTTQIWRVGTGEADPKFESHDDEHPEYVADDYLSISQGPHIVNPKTGQPETERGGAMVESRVAGRYGTHGWMEREGFAKPRPQRGHPKAPRERADDDPGVD